MKRKRGHKKGKLKGASAAAKSEARSNDVILNEDNSNNVDEYGNDEYESPAEVDTPSSTGTDQPLNVASINPDGSIDKALGKPIGRVKVKLKTSKMLDSSHSDTDKSSSQMGLERPGGAVDRMEDSAISLAEMKLGVLGNAAKKAGSIKIKSSKVMGNSSVGKTGNGTAAQGESSHQKQPKKPRLDPQYNKEELDAALSVIKKVMKMDAAEPFNAPVNPEALGIPDYFDVIDTPMDFGTICSNLEIGHRYVNSEDVYKDVQYIWENCNKYNNKGDYILDLMKRVKKNFMKYWTAAGLYNEQTRGNTGVEIFQVEDVLQSSQGKVQVKSVQSKQKSGKRHGRRHKHDCLCAICVLKRRKREREENARIAKGQFGVDAQEIKQEESSSEESPGEDSSSDMGESQDLDADAEVEGRREKEKMESTEPNYSHMEEKHEEEEEEEEEDDEEGEEEEDNEEEKELEIQEKGEGQGPEQSQLSERSGKEPIGQSESGGTEKPGSEVQPHSQKDEEETAADKQKEDKESKEREEKAKMYASFNLQSPMLLNLCGILFPNNHKSVWSGPHSLVQRQDTACTSSIHAAIESFMK